MRYLLSSAYAVHVMDCFLHRNTIQDSASHQKYIINFKWRCTNYWICEKLTENNAVTVSINMCGSNALTWSGQLRLHR